MREGVVFALILSLLIPLPLAGSYAHAKSSDPGTRFVHQRLNSPERARAIEEARRLDAAAHEAYAEEQRTRSVPSAETSSQLSADSTATAKSSPSVPAERPKSVTEVMFNGVTGFMGLPGLQSNYYDPYNPNVDQGLGFHADGTARRADGTTGNNAASANFDGRRAAGYAAHGMGYGPNGMRGGYGISDMGGYYGAGYDPISGTNWRQGDPTSAAYHARRSGGGAWGDQIFSDPQSYFMQRGLNYGMGMVNSAAEGLFLGVMESPYGGAKARLNFQLDLDGRLNGEGDVLLPFYDNKYTTVFTQLGARSMSGMSGGGKDGRGADRWIGNFGLGQRWYPMAVNEGIGQDAGNLMLGYNVFFDNDFTRSHQRGGVGLETQYDWLHLAANYYVPLSSWKGSYDFDSHFVKERAAEGWDMRAKGYLPFYRNVAVTGAYSQWKGDRVAMYSSRDLEKDPRVWSYGVEYTPIPLVSGFVNQRSTERGRSDTEFGLRLTYTFDMPWDEQTSHAKVAEMRTVGGSRHEFVDRENRIILEYKANNRFHIESLGLQGNEFVFRIKNGFDKYVAGQVVRVSAGGGVSLADASSLAPKSYFAQAVDFLDSLISVSVAYAATTSGTYTSDANGYVRVPLTTPIPSGSTLTIQAGDTSITVPVLGGASSRLNFTTASYATAVNTDISMQVTLANAVGGEQINWSIDTPVTSGITIPANSTISGTTANVTLTVAGSNVHRKVTVTGTLDSDPSVKATAVVTVGTALPSSFIAMSSATLKWEDGGSYPAANFCSQQGGRLPKVNNNISQSMTVVRGSTANIEGIGTVDTNTWSTPWSSTGLPSGVYWTGTEVTDYPGFSWVFLDNGGGVHVYGADQGDGYGVVCVP